MLDPLPRPVRILDVGGDVSVWRDLGLAGDPTVQITILNLTRLPSGFDNVVTTAGDARDMSRYADGSFDVVYSNSVIEHVGGPDDIRRMAGEIRRIGRRYFVQTPNRRFPVEPHFVFPGFQFLPRPVQVALVRRFDLGWMRRHPDPGEARAAVESIHLLTRRQLAACFPDASIRDERILGLSKSLIASRWPQEA